MTVAMPRPSRLKLTPLDLGGETFGERLSRIRKERGFTQAELAAKVGIIQVLVSDYERGKLRLNAEMIVRFALALGVSADEMLGMKRGKGNGHRPRRRVLRRLEQIERLPAPRQRALMTTIDTYLEAAEHRKAGSG